MSGSGYMRIQIEMQRQAELLKLVQQTADTCMNHLNGLNSEILSANNQQFGQILQELKEIKNAKYPNVDRAYENLKTVKSKVARVEAEAEGKIKSWDVVRQQLEANWAEINREMKMLGDNNIYSHKPEFTLLITEFNEIEAAYQRRETANVIALKNELMTHVESFKASVIDETVRKQVVGTIIQILKNMGFEIAAPKLQTKESGNTQVLLSGALPNGELVTFRIEQDGKTHFDMKNFQQTYCKDRLELIRKDLESKMKNSVLIEQWEWHNPDLLRKGSKDLPNSGTYKYKQK